MKKISTKLSVVKTMPKLQHRIPNEEYDVAESNVVKWLIQQPDVLQHLFETMKDRKLIKYNSDTSTWQGIEYEEACPHGYSDWDDCPDCRH